MSRKPQDAAVTEQDRPAVASPSAQVRTGPLVLVGAMRELWVTFAFKALGVAAYQVMNVTLILWLSRDLGYDDQQAGYLVAAWSISMTVFTILVGSLTDALGLRKTFFLGVWICIFARLVMTFATAKWLALGFGLIPLALGEALGTPVLVAAIRRYSTTAQRSISFSLFYVMMNVGLFAGYYLFDFLRNPDRGMGEYGHWVVPVIGVTLTTYQTLFLLSFIIEICLLPLIYFGIRKGAEATDEGIKITVDEPRYPGESIWNSARLSVRDAIVDTGRNLSSLARQDGFYRLLGFLMLIAFVKLIFMTMYYLYPKFGIRELGEGAPVGMMSGVNSILIIFIVPVIGVLAQKMSAYRAITLGCIISAVSVFVMALPTSWFQGMADGPLGQLLGHWYLGLKGDVSPWYIMSFFFIVLLSLGEAFYSPRVYEYATAIAPKGQEASYASLSYVPFFLAKLCVGVFSGKLLMWYCPEQGPRDSSTMWLIIALATTLAPIGLIVLRPWIRVREAGRED